MSLARLDDVKNALGLSTTEEDGKLTLFLAAAEASVKQVCYGIDFESTTRTEYHQPDGKELLTKFKPVSSITSINEDPTAYFGDGSGAWASTTLLTAGTQYALNRDGSGVNGEVSRSGIVYRLGSMWLRQASFPSVSTILGTNWNALLRKVEPAIGAVKIVYVSGYTTVPADVTMAVVAEVIALRQRAGTGGAPLSEEHLAEYGYKVMTPVPGDDPLSILLSDIARRLLRPYLGMRLVL